MSEPTGYGPDYYKSESELRAELAAKDARIAALEHIDAEYSRVCEAADESLYEARDEIKALRKELAEAKAALTRTQDASLWWDQYNLEVRKHTDTKAALEAANARIASLMTGADRYWEERWRNAERLCDQRGTALEAANARIAELEPRGAIADLVSNLRGRIVELHDRAERAEAIIVEMSDKGCLMALRDGATRAERAEAERDALREALEDAKPFVQHSFECGARTRVLDKIRAALNPSPAGEKI